MLKEASSEETALELTIKEMLARQIAEAQKALDDMLVGSYFAWMQQCRKRTHNPYHSRTCCYFNFTRGMTGTREGAPLSIQAVRQGDARVPCFRCTAGYMVLRIPFVKNGPAGGGVRRGRRRVRLRSARGRVCSAHRRTAACWAHDEPHARAGDRAHPADCVPHAGARPREHAACGHARTALRHEPRVQRLQGALDESVPHDPSRQVQAPARRGGHQGAQWALHASQEGLLLGLRATVLFRSVCVCANFGKRLLWHWQRPVEFEIRSQKCQKCEIASVVNV